MPSGWFELARPDEIGAGHVVTRRAFGTELVLWRDGDGQVVCQEARCPHAGAHLGVGGTVAGGCIRCPFHGWRFDADGTNAATPYPGHPNGRHRLRTYPVREHGDSILAWSESGVTRQQELPQP